MPEHLFSGNWINKVTPFHEANWIRHWIPYSNPKETAADFLRCHEQGFPGSCLLVLMNRTKKNSRYKRLNIFHKTSPIHFMASQRYGCSLHLQHQHILCSAEGADDHFPAVFSVTQFLTGSHPPADFLIV